MNLMVKFKNNNCTCRAILHLHFMIRKLIGESTMMKIEEEFTMLQTWMMIAQVMDILGRQVLVFIHDLIMAIL